MTHTPGPWKYEGSIYEHMGAGIRSIPDDRGVAQVWQHPNVVADACLMAAAPEMLEALKVVMQHGRIDDSASRMDMVGAVIARAEGRQVLSDALTQAQTNKIRGTK